jgi:hypothetical protein
VKIDHIPSKIDPDTQILVKRIMPVSVLTFSSNKNVLFQRPFDSDAAVVVVLKPQRL